MLRIANTPFDTVKSRMQNQLKVSGEVMKYNWTLPSLKLVIQEEGIAAAYKVRIINDTIISLSAGCREQCFHWIL